MRFVRLCRILAVWIACIGIIIPHAKADSRITRDNQTKSSDVMLSEGGRLQGWVINSEGIPIGGTTVQVRNRGQVVATVTTDDEGRFVANALRGGVYEVVADDGSTLVRLWSLNTAPPTARKNLLVISGEDVVRGAWCNCGWLGGMPNPWAVALIVGAAIAIPLALDDDDEPASL